MSTTQIVLCGEASADRPRENRDVLRLRNTNPGRSVHLRIEDISRSLATDVPPQFADLIEIATYVYVADQSHKRGGDGVDDMGANWRRPFHFEIPVRRPDFWQRTEITKALRDVLSFLSEDEYTFVFRHYRSPPPLTRYMDFARYDYGAKPERVILFSGGLDSLGGVVREAVVDGRPAVLVSHRSTSKFVNRHRMLRAMLDDRASAAKPLHVTVRINKRKELNQEYTQRSRSFLYASLAVTIAKMCRLNEIRFYENGTISLNLPISQQVVGSKATRTTHPRVLSGFQRLFSLIDDEPFGVTNPFLWKTKGEVVKSILDAGCGGMIEWSTSCTHTWETTNAKPHCGTCSQCIDRRFAVLAAGAGAFERADTYAVDLLTDPRSEGEPRTMLASYVETAQQVAAMTETEFFVRFGEVARIVRQLGGAADENARRIFELYRRHGREVIAVVDAALAKHASDIRTRSLPDSCLLRLVHDPGVSPDWGGKAALESPARQAPEPDYLFQQRGEGWRLRFAGHETQWLKPAVGYIYLREVLRFPHKRFTVAQLLVAAYGEKASVPLGDGGEVLDAQAKKAYARRLAELDDELEEARDHNDPGRQEKLESDRETLLAEVRNSGWKSVPKRSRSDLNNIRNSVCNAIRRALGKINEYEPSASAHLEPNIALGFSVEYHPPELVPWSF